MLDGSSVYVVVAEDTEVTMGCVRFEGGEKFEVLIESTEDRAALRAAMKATPGSDIEAVGDGAVLHFDSDNPSNVVAFWAAGFEWQPPAHRAALDLIVPLAWQQIGIHSNIGRFTRRDRKQLGLGDMSDMLKQLRKKDES